MHGSPRQAGFSVVEMLVSLTVFAACFASLAPLLIHSSRSNRSTQVSTEVRSSARNCMSMIVQTLRSAGWDPINAGIPVVALDADPGDAVSEIEVFADLDEDGATDGDGEQVLIRHLGDEVLWRTSSAAGAPFVILASNITNDANGDGVPEPMFVPDSTTAPTRVVVRLTAESPVPDPVTGEVRRFTVESEVALRKNL